MRGAFEELQAMVGQESELQVCKDDVNKAMIRHWCEAMEDGNPLYTDEAYAKTSKYGGIVAPPQMVQAFSTPPLWPKREDKQDPFAKAVKRMGDDGYFGIVATTTTQEYLVPMRPGDQLSFKVKLAGLSPEKTTRIGTGHFVTAEYTYINHGRVPGATMVMTAPNDHFGSLMAYGFATPPSWVAMFTTRYMHEFGATPEQLGAVSVVLREYACRNPNAMFYGKPITMEDYMASRMVVWPLRLYDCCVDTDGAVAVVVTTTERARDLKQTPAIIMGTTQGIATQGEMMTSLYRPIISGLPESWYAAEELWHLSGVSPKDVDVVQFYDAFTPLIPMQLEEYGFCERGEGAAYCEGGDRIRLGGELPCNTSGGHLSEAYITA